MLYYILVATNLIVTIAFIFIVARLFKRTYDLERRLNGAVEYKLVKIKSNRIPTEMDYKYEIGDTWSYIVDGKEQLYQLTGFKADWEKMVKIEKS